MHPVRISKFISLALRHRARDFDLKPDAVGFVAFDSLLAVAQTQLDANITQDMIIALVETGKPKRYELRGSLIRATYGHSRVAVDYPPVAPPEILYHGTHPRAIVSIRRHGLKAMTRQYVHLSTSQGRAREVSLRRTRAPRILVVRALEAHAAGVIFHSPEPNHFLARRIAPGFIGFPVESFGAEDRR